MPIEKITFPGHDGQSLAARLDRPPGRPRAYALFTHCFTCSKDLAAARRIAAALADSGIAVLRFDFTGLGHSQGEFANTSFTTNVADLVLAADHMRATLEAPAILIGHSLGGAATIAAAARIPEAKAVVTIGAPAEPAHVTHALGASLETIERDGSARVTLAGRDFTITRDFVEDVREASLRTALADLRKALLVLHAPRDETVGIENASAIFTAAKHPKSFVTLDDADHLLTSAEDAEYAASVIAAWVARYLPPAADDAAAARHEGVVRVSEDSPAGLLQHVSVDGRFPLIADEPRSLGGSDLGPTPYQFLSVALGACTAMTLRMYARRKKLALDSVVVDVTHDKVHAEDSSDAEAGTHRRADRFVRRLRIAGDLTPAERARLLEIADMCPVHRTLEHASVIETSEEED
ncbi:bifunctional alpha/beta hydrolase/OsmC family protein [Salinarimonas rosea]|uniref:bifunctional alpha/beta hydrolase/OsmC family protein n=1 Tax=Salinarimonas rosea TaxID=552063 RepID=UPI000428E1F7|nr:bifunctional alpha/beta hydrolase/OsmC family protein [Salinarimonas rosea]